MSKRIRFAFFILGLAVLPLQAQFDSGSTGQDGNFSPTVNTTLDCRPRVPDCVFNFGTVNIPANVTVNFMPNRFNSPVYILAQGDVVIAGRLTLAGSRGMIHFDGGRGGAGGPGGFRGGDGGSPGPAPADRLGGAGLGPGGGVPDITPCRDGDGSFGTVGLQGNTRPVYGLETLVPLVGGSGGAGGSCVPCQPVERASGGGGGGGAILIASSTTIAINGNGEVDARGGCGEGGSGCAGRNGSGGGIRLVANTISGDGTIAASGCSQAGEGRVRLESSTPIPGSLRIPTRRSIFIFMSFAPPTVSVPALPSLRIATLDSTDIPFPPQGGFGGTDVSVIGTGTRNVGLVASRIPLGTTVQVTVKPEKASGSVITITTPPLTGTFENSTTSATVNLPALGAYFIEARATFTVPAGGAEESMKIEGEKVKQVHVETAQGAGSKVMYILESGKQIPAEQVALASSRGKQTAKSKK